MGKDKGKDNSVVTYTRRDGRQAMTSVTKHEREALQRMGRLVKDHSSKGK